MKALMGIDGPKHRAPGDFGPAAYTERVCAAVTTTSRIGPVSNVL
jgi:hypothetical protein